MEREFPLMQTVCQGIFIIAVTLLSLSWLFNKLRDYITGSKTELSRHIETDGLLDSNRNQQQECRQRMQEQHNSKASYYQEHIFKPREDAKRLKKEKEFLKFLGPAWLTEGAVLGGEDCSSDEDDDVSEGRRAANRRNIPEQINQRVAAQAAATASARLKTKRVIKLPEEPDINQDGVVCVMLRTPIGTICQRRFLATDKIQCLFDYITTQGFSKRLYAVSTSYPRMLLENSQSCFLDYNFGKRVALNIEERQ